MFDDEKVPQPVPLQVDPLAVQFRLPPSLEVAIRETVCVTVSAGRFGEMATLACGGLMVMLSDGLATCFPVESVTVKINPVVIWAVVGVPVIAPEVEKDSPAGSVPLRDQLYGGVPPAAERAALYAAPTCPSGRELVVTARVNGAIVKARVLEEL